MRSLAQSRATISSIGAATTMPGSVRVRIAASRPMARSARCATIKSPEAWLAQVEAHGHGIMSDEALSAEDAAEEYLLMGLRLADGIDLSRFAAIGGSALDEDRLDALESDGLITRNGSRVAATTQGRLVLNWLILELAA